MHIFAYLVLGWVIWRLFGILIGYREYLHYSRQGVSYISKGFSVVRDAQTMKKALDEFPYALSWSRVQLPAMKMKPGDRLPCVLASNIMGRTLLSFTNADILRDLYVNKNQATTKHWVTRLRFHPLIPDTILTQATESPHYLYKRKALSQAFFKQKLILMTRIIKKVTLEEIQALQRLPQSERELVSIPQLTTNLQGKIIINIAVGPASAS